MSLTRRTFLTTIAAAPLAQFCKTEPVRPYVFKRNVISIEDAERKFGLKPGTLRVQMFRNTTGMTLIPSRLVALPQGTLE